MPTLRLLPEFEDELKRLPGIIAASVVTGPDAVPNEIHVLAEPGKPPKQVVRDVQSFAMLKLGLDIDHRIVSVVQIGATTSASWCSTTTTQADADDPRTRAARGRRSARSWCGPRAARPRPWSRSRRPAGTSSTAARSARAGPRTAAGWSRRRRSTPSRSCSAARPTSSRRRSSPAGAREVALTVLSVSVPRLGEQLLTGSALVRGDESEAVARSVLDALNRRLTG